MPGEPPLDPATGLAWVLSAWLAGGLLTLPLETLIRPGTGRRRRPPAAWAIQAGLWTLAFSVLMLLSQRPVFAAALALAGALLVVLVNNAKYQALQEPFLFSDFGLFSQALKHPRLYLPFLGLGPALLGSVAICLSLYLGLTLEPALPAHIGWNLFLAFALGGAGLAGGLLWRGARAAAQPTLDPLRDLRDMGLAASLWLYWRLEQTRSDPPVTSPLPSVVPRPAAQRAHAARGLPHVLAVQSESFFDARRLMASIRPEILEHFDRLSLHAAVRGRLTVPAWGANTMRTEFGFLTGIPADDLGVHRFNPYRRFARRPIPSLASQLNALGYRTLCIHPHPVSFFARDRVYPQLGFDEFIDVRRFDPGETCGPYICDAAITRMIGELLETTDRPLFVFAITMENHGPLHLEKVSAAEATHLYTTPPPAGLDDLTVYLRHLRNADQMLGEVSEMLAGQSRGGLLCWFGDHVPSMPQVYAANGFTDGRTDYLIWHSDRQASGHEDLSVEQLGPALLDAAGLTTTNRRFG